MSEILPRIGYLGEKKARLVSSIRSVRRDSQAYPRIGHGVSARAVLRTAGILSGKMVGIGRVNHSKGEAAKVKEPETELRAKESESQRTEKPQGIEDAAKAAKDEMAARTESEWRNEELKEPLSEKEELKELMIETEERLAEFLGVAQEVKARADEILGKKEESAKVEVETVEAREANEKLETEPIPRKKKKGRKGKRERENGEGLGMAI